jgi:hypothetical protein
VPSWPRGDAAAHLSVKGTDGAFGLIGLSLPAFAGARA